jgi:hypothetical protein
LTTRSIPLSPAVAPVSLDAATASTVVRKSEEFDQARGGASNKPASSVP